MKQIRVFFTDFALDFDINNNDFVNILRSFYVVEIDPKNPEYLFYSTFGTNYLKFDCIRIFYTGECITPNFNVCDYAIGYDRMVFGDRYLRVPLYRLFQYRLLYDKLFERETIHSVDTSKDFCSFVCSNCFADELRLKMFKELSKYKKVNSGGRFMNNVGGPVPNKYEFQLKHKFAIAFENGSYDGYLTEKLVDAFAARVVPIYWGDPRVELDFNEDSFINGNKYDSISAIVERVIEIDNDDELYLKILNENPILEDKRDNSDLVDFLIGIFNQPIDKAKRRPYSRWARDYESFLLRHRWFEETIYNKIVRIKNLFYRFFHHAI